MEVLVEEEVAWEVIVTDKAGDMLVALEEVESNSFNRCTTGRDLAAARVLSSLQIRETWSGKTRCNFSMTDCARLWSRSRFFDFPGI